MHDLALNKDHIHIYYLLTIWWKNLRINMEPGVEMRTNESGGGDGGYYYMMTLVGSERAGECRSRARQGGSGRRAKIAASNHFLADLSVLFLIGHIPPNR